MDQQFVIFEFSQKEFLSTTTIKKKDYVIPSRFEIKMDGTKTDRLVYQSFDQHGENIILLKTFSNN